MRRKFISLLILAIVSSILTGIATIGLLAFTFQTLRADEFDKLHEALTFAVLIVSFILCRIMSSLTVGYLSNGAATEMRKQVARRIIAVPLTRLEDVGTSRLLAALSADALTVSAALPKVVQFSTYATIVICLLAYLGWLSPEGAFFVLVAASIGMPLHWALIKRAARLSYTVGQMRDQLYRHFEALVLGVKQLQMNSDLRREFLRVELDQTQADFEKLSSRALLTRLLATSSAQFILWSLIGYLIVVWRVDSPGQPNGAVEFVFGVIYLMGPLEALVGSISSLSGVRTALKRMRDIGLALHGVQATSKPESAVSWSADGALNPLMLEGVTYTYADERAFVVGPIDVAMNLSNIVFVTGGNGSGKSTFIKLLTGLYVPDHGKIFLGGREIDESRRQRYREQFSAIYDDVYLFERVWNGQAAAIERAAREQLQSWGLDELVKFEEGRFSNTRALSRGQRKRLALVASLLEDRPIYVFDEWAADQDAKWRQRFYRTLLPQLRQMGKLVVVITHDEGYGHIANQVLHFHEGRLAKVGIGMH